jgi:ribosomal protein S18 acetylase RimI-like enzyme
VVRVIRALAPGDVDAVVSVLGLARLHQGDGVYLVAWEGTEPVGHLHLALTDPPELQDVEVREAFRGRGIGTELIAAAEAECAMRRLGAVQVTVSVDNEGARALYERLGYRDSGLAPRRVTGTIEIRSGPIEVDDTLVILEKRLDA